MISLQVFVCLFAWQHKNAWCHCLSKLCYCQFLRTKNNSGKISVVVITVNLALWNIASNCDSVYLIESYGLLLICVPIVRDTLVWILWFGLEMFYVERITVIVLNKKGDSRFLFTSQLLNWRPFKRASHFSVKPPFLYLCAPKKIHKYQVKPDLYLETAFLKCIL